MTRPPVWALDEEGLTAAQREARDELIDPSPPDPTDIAEGPWL